MSEYWNRIRKHYARNTPAILKAAANDWAIDPYAWNGFIELTPIEQALWVDIRSLNAVFYPQYPVGNFFVDFANPVAKVVIECDGRAFHLDKEKDADRDAILNSMGWVVFRFTGSECVKDRDEETGEPSTVFQMVEAIVNHYGLKFKAKRKTCFSFDELIVGYANNIWEAFELGKT